MAERGTKLLLDNQEVTDVFFEETKLLGVMAPLRDYLFCWHINETLGMDFRMNNDIEIQLTRKKRNYFFRVYEFCVPSRSLSHFVYNNQFDGEYLLPEFKHLDYLWLMKGEEIGDELLNETIGAIRSIHGVQLVLELSPEKIKNKEHLVF
ncbi:MAG TPA: IPExxxVDY family protein [Chitinophagaceae bacterium]|nr:IPExxxVDY family protein [Chitinophagaceae bacterium]